MKGNWKAKIASVLALVTLGTQALVSTAIPLKAYADEAGTVTWTNDNTSTITGTKNGQPYSGYTTPLYVNGKHAFCLEPGVPINSSNESGYVGNPANGNIPRRAKIAMAIWSDVFGNKNVDTIKIAQSVVYGNLEGANKLIVDHISGIDDTFLKTKQKQLNDAITAYDQKPSFNGQTIKIKLGETVELTNTTAGVNLSDFDRLLVNTSNLEVKVNGNKVTLKAVDSTKDNGVISFAKSWAEGTPYVYRKSGQQTLGIGAIDDPNTWLIKAEIDTTGKAKIVKQDANSGALIANTEFLAEYSGTDAPKSHTIKTGADGSYTIDKIPAGVKIKITEKKVPAPYVLASATGGNDVYEGTIKAGETITLTAKNIKQVGQVVVTKTGKETGTNHWNDNYNLKGTTFDIRKEKVDGEIVGTITADEKGVATSAKNLEVGKQYYVTEKKAGEGFANTFEPQKFTIEYAGQTVAVAVGKVSGTNQEVVAETTITKQDAETAGETQGSATFKGAEYTLYYKDGEKKDQPVKWSDPFKPVIKVGNKANNETVTIRINEQSLQAGVKHLALGNYYWKETKAPVGYQIDPNKYDIAAKYENQDVNVVTKDATSKEKVIKFNLDGFKYVTSKNGSAQSGYNGIKFELTPIAPTKGDKKTAETHTDANGYDGYFSFTDIPFGDYEMTEVNEPEGFEKIQPLVINSSYDSGNKQYVFTITEKGQKEPIKIVKFDEDKINTGSNVVSLSKLFLYDETVQIPEVGTTLTTDTDNKFIYADGKVKLKDTIKYDKMKRYIGKELTANGVLTANGEPVLIDGKEITATAKFTPKKESGLAEVVFEFDASQLDIDTITKLTAFETILDSDGNVVAEHKDPDDIGQTITIKVENPEIGTSLTTEKDDKLILADGTIKLKDTISYDKMNRYIGKELTANGVLTADGEPVLIDGKEITGTAKFTPKREKGTVEVWFEFDGLKLDEETITKLTAFETVLDTNGKVVAEHKDPEDEEQTVKVEYETPEIGTTLETEGGEKNIVVDVNYSDSVIKLKDTISYDKMSRYIGKEVIANGVLTANGTPILIDEKEVTGTATFTPEAKKGTVEVWFEFDAAKLDPDLISKLTAFEEFVDPEGKVIAEHKDPEDVGQTIEVEYETPEIGTTLTHENGDKVIYADGIVKVKDTIAYKGMKGKIGKEVTANGVLTVDGKPVLIDEKEITGTTTFTLEDEEGSVEVWFEFDATKLDPETISKLTAFEEFVDANGNLIAEHKDPEDPSQTVEVKYPQVQTEATYADGTKEAIGSKEAKTIDKLSYQNLPKGEYFVVTKAFDKQAEKVIKETESKQESDGKDGAWEIEQDLDTSEAANHDIVYFEYVYKDEEKTQLVAKHEDPEDVGQTIKVLEEKPEIVTNAHNGDKKTQTISAAKDTKAHDTVNISKVTPEHEYVYEYEVARIEGNSDKAKTDNAIRTGSFEFKAEKDSFEKELEEVLDTSNDPDGTKYVWSGKLKNKDGEIVADHYDLMNEKQTLTVKAEEPTPKETPTSATPKETPASSGSLPKTGETVMKGLGITGVVGLIALGAFYLIRKRKDQEASK